MIAADGEVLYVGKARNLKNRLTTYFVGKAQAAKTMAMVAQIATVEVTVTASETEALLLEYNLIKRHKPRYNVTLRDDKSFPYLYIPTTRTTRASASIAAARKLPGRFFGPYPNARATRETLLLLQKLFLMRPCSDTFFANRSRPCLQHQIKRCSAPCVALISKEEYAQDIADAIKVLEGRGAELIEDLAARMEEASQKLEFERAARLRDQINGIKAIHSTQSVTRNAAQDIDAVALFRRAASTACRSSSCAAGAILAATISFQGGPGGSRRAAVRFPRAVLPRVAKRRRDPDQRSDRRRRSARGDADGKDGARRSASAAACAVCARAGSKWRGRMRSSASRCGARPRRRRTSSCKRSPRCSSLPAPPARIECFDVSHTMGERTVASCVVFGRDGPLKSDYRRFNIEGLAPGDDYGAMRQALSRRYARIKKGEAPMPDLLLIDGGAGQLAEAVKVLSELEIEGVAVAGVAKGADRRPGQERLFLPHQDLPIILPPDSPALHLIQRIRDEAHRFAITGHRQRRAKARTRIRARNGSGTRTAQAS